MLLKRRVQELVDLADKIAREFIKSKGALTGELSIGSGETFKYAHTLSVDCLVPGRKSNGNNPMLLISCQLYSRSIHCFEV